MDKLKSKISSIFYNFNTEDRYAGFQSKQKTVETPFQTKLANSSTAYINASLTEYPEESMSAADGFHDTDMKDLSNGEGVHEATLAWKHIRMWTSKYQPDLHEALSSPCTKRDLIEAQNDLKVTFPECVVRSLMTHDGQDSMPGTSGLIFGLELMDLDSIVKMTKMWRKVSERIQNEQAHKIMMSKLGNMSQPQLVHKNTNNISQASRINNLNQEQIQQLDPLIISGTSSTTKNYKTDVPRQSSIPPGAVNATYAHPNWIPLLTDNAGNHVGVDLAPGPTGKWGQVIIFGREFDTKYVVAPTWGDFLLIFANDLELKNWRIEGDDDNLVGNGEVVFNDHETKRDQLYLSVLVGRSIKIYKTQLQKEKKKVNNSKQLPRIPDLIDASSPVVNELEVFPDGNSKNTETKESDTEEEKQDAPKDEVELHDVLL